MSPLRSVGYYPKFAAAMMAAMVGITPHDNGDTPVDEQLYLDGEITYCDEIQTLLEMLAGSLPVDPDDLEVIQGIKDAYDNEMLKELIDTGTVVGLLISKQGYCFFEQAELTCN